MTLISKTISVLIQDRTINKSNVQNLANTFYSIYKDWKKKERKQIEFIVICENETVFRTSSPAIFDTDDPINLNRVLSIEMRFSTDSGTEIQIILTHNPTNDAQNKIIIEGTDSTWVNGTMKKLEEIIDTFNPQNNFIKRYGLIMNFIFSVSVGAIASTIAIKAATLWVPNFSTSEISQTVDILQQYPAILLKYLLFTLVGFIPASILMGKLNKLYPKIEFQIGPEHKLTEKTQRQWVINAIIFGVIPFLLTFFSDIARNFFSN